eukprot:scaffold2784_cov109-Cylindrotheca_fusiformis.AAC.7
MTSQRQETTVNDMPCVPVCVNPINSRQAQTQIFLSAQRYYEAEQINQNTRYGTSREKKNRSQKIRKERIDVCAILARGTVVTAQITS